MKDDVASLSQYFHKASFPKKETGTVVRTEIIKWGLLLANKHAFL